MLERGLQLAPLGLRLCCWMSQPEGLATLSCCDSALCNLKLELLHICCPDWPCVTCGSVVSKFLSDHRFCADSISQLVSVSQ
jgi:hypothetical protein